MFKSKFSININLLKKPKLKKINEYARIEKLFKRKKWLEKWLYGIN